MHHPIVIAIYVPMDTMPDREYATKYHNTVKHINLSMASVLHAKTNMFTVRVGVFFLQWV
jgi:hypothetical protein